jgi:transposase
MRRVIGMDIHRTFAEVVFWEDGRLRHHGRIDMTRSGLEGFGRSLEPEDEIVIEATGNAMSVVRVLSPFARVLVANPMQVKAIAHARIKTDKIDAGVLAQLQASGFLPEVWVPDPRTERLRRLVARRTQVVRHRTRVKNEVHGILQAHLVPQYVRMRICSTGVAAPGSRSRWCRRTNALRSTDISVRSIGSAKTWLCWTAI